MFDVISMSLDHFTTVHGTVRDDKTCNKMNDYKPKQTALFRATTRPNLNNVTERELHSVVCDV